jgi:site-specific DNA recombinase
MMDLAVAGAFDVVVVWKRDRFGRHAVGTGFFEMVLRQAGVRLEAIQTGPSDERPQTQFVNRMMDAVAELEAANIRERCQMGRDAAVRRGEWPGRAPFGFVKDAKKRLVPHPTNAAEVRAGFDGYLLGWTVEEVGLRWQVTMQAAHLRLRNATYAGRATFGGVEVPVPAIVWPPDWERVQAALKARRNTPKVRVLPFERREALRPGDEAERALGAGQDDESADSQAS